MASRWKTCSPTWTRNDLPLWPALIHHYRLWCNLWLPRNSGLLWWRVVWKTRRTVAASTVQWLVKASSYFNLVCTSVSSFFGSVESLSDAIANGGPGNVVYSASFGLMGVFGGILAFLGVVILPIKLLVTQHSVRLILAEYQHGTENTACQAYRWLYRCAWWHPDSRRWYGLALLWLWQSIINGRRVLWTASAYLLRHNKLHWVTTVPAIFMIACVSHQFWTTAN